ncbi:oligoendopeptidase F [Aerococcaceae bacterium WGS1372]
MSLNNGPLPKREELNIEETWDTSLLYASQADYEQAKLDFKENVLAFVENFKGKLTTAADILQSLAAYEEIYRDYSKISHYGFLGYEVNKLDEDNESNAVKLGQLSEWLGAQITFYDLELAALSEDLLEEVKSTEGSEAYIPYIDTLLYIKPTMLTAEVEQALSSLGGSIYNQSDLYSASKFQDMTFDSFEVDGVDYSNSFAGFEQDYEGHVNKEVRHAAWKSFHDGLSKYQHTIANNYINHVQTEKKMATLRGFDSVFDYLLHSQKMTVDSYNLIIDTLTTELAPVFRRYASLLKKEHNLDQVTLADIKMPFSTDEAEHITIEESRTMVESALSVLGEEYSEYVRRAFDERWIDYPMNLTKSTGGFCATVSGGPSYILLNWTGLLSEVLVLAHELGHAGHFQSINDYQLAITPEPSLYFIEAPSTANEVIMCQYLLNQPIDNASKRSLLAEFVTRTYFHNMVTHLLEADFQRKVYQAVDNDEVLNAHRLNEFFKESLKNFWGDAVVINDGAELTWMRQPHYYMGLYSYTYSAGLTIGTQVGQKIAEGEQEIVDAWLANLRAGGTQTALELAANVGVDMTTDEPIRQAIQFVDSLLDQIEELA